MVCIGRSVVGDFVDYFVIVWMMNFKVVWCVVLFVVKVSLVVSDGVISCF